MENLSFSKLFVLYLLTAAVFFAIDILWLGFIAKDFYQKYLGAFFRDKVNWTAALIFYLLFILGLVVFTIYPAFKADALSRAILLGLFFGLVTYATYDLTNLATLRDWPLKIVMVDMVWGMVLSGTVSTCGFFIAKWLH